MNPSLPVPANAPPAPDASRPSPFPRLPIELQPHPNLFKYYALTSLLLGPFFWMLLIPMYFRYHTMRYKVEEEGVTMRWGILFRREVSLTYARIQDIHLTSNFVERWLGLAKVQVQTASGSSTAEMTIEGLLEFEAIRDFLYARMRGARDRGGIAAGKPHAGELPAGSAEALTDTLREIAQEIRSLREALPVAVRREGSDV